MKPVLGTVYVITKGSYSSYRIVTVLSTRALALEFCSHDPELMIEPYNVDNWGDQIALGLGLYNVSMEKTGDGRAWVCSDGPYESLHLRQVHMNSSPYLEMSGCIWAKDAQHALKIASERRAELIALGQWKVQPKAKPRKKASSNKSKTK